MQVGVNLHLHPHLHQTHHCLPVPTNRVPVETVVPQGASGRGLRGRWCFRAARVVLQEARVVPQGASGRGLEGTVVLQEARVVPQGASGRGLEGTVVLQEARVVPQGASNPCQVESVVPQEALVNPRVNLHHHHHHPNHSANQEGRQDHRHQSPQYRPSSEVRGVLQEVQGEHPWKVALEVQPVGPWKVALAVLQEPVLQASKPGGAGGTGGVSPGGAGGAGGSIPGGVGVLVVVRAVAVAWFHHRFLHSFSFLQMAWDILPTLLEAV